MGHLIRRMQEERRHLGRTDDRGVAGPGARASRRNHQAIAVGRAESGRTIAAAAGIVALVFGSFVLDSNRPLQEFGFGLGFAVLVDALAIRSLLMPAVTHLIGPANRTMPSWPDRVLPNLSAEVDEDAGPLPLPEQPVPVR